MNAVIIYNFESNSQLHPHLQMSLATVNAVIIYNFESNSQPDASDFQSNDNCECGNKVTILKAIHNNFYIGCDMLDTVNAVIKLQF